MIQYHSEDMSMFHHSPGNPLLPMTRIEQKWGLCNALKPNLSRMKTRPHRFTLELGRKGWKRYLKLSRHRIPIIRGECDEFERVIQRALLVSISGMVESP